MTPEDAPLAQLIDRLIALTQKDVLVWHDFEGRALGFEIDLEGTTSNIDIFPIDADGAAPFCLRVWDRRESGNFEKVTEANSKDDRDWATPLGRLYSAIERNRAGATRTITKILEALDNLDDTDQS